MDLFLVFITMFLVANMMLVVTMLRRVDLNNPSVQAWEAQNATAVLQPAAAVTYTPAYVPEAQ
ncbi:MAG: hypothetical protein CML20_02000 [Rheinheimera sp.]|uniref:hypothetical protein n=1 Tax=Arsukibacterium sp. UBA3155 TaxID=1946058 RepID=UPI000C8EACC5|nr:hypothetical protein [Arsukibacterium sp. UBA3155]MAD73573.1 hypothetical protein [Rheinheimera sp.]|tara:strand:+ start:114666 stop:114854 length:189 start_codon:yes stop_codon:yes gene_type:complete